MTTLCVRLTLLVYEANPQDDKEELQTIPLLLLLRPLPPTLLCLHAAVGVGNFKVLFCSRKVDQQRHNFLKPFY